jgi:hypothetical protein
MNEADEEDEDEEEHYEHNNSAIYCSCPCRLLPKATTHTKEDVCCLLWTVGGFKGGRGGGGGGIPRELEGPDDDGLFGRCYPSW